MKTIIFFVVAVISLALVGCSASSDIEVNNDINLTTFGGQKYWKAIGYGESVKMDLAYDMAVLSARNNLARYLTKPIVSDSGVCYEYDLLQSQVKHQQIEQIGQYWTAKVVVIAPFNFNLKK